MRLLILGGSSEASALARHLAGDDSCRPTLSLAGRTRNPVLPPIAHRIGGFGGVAGLEDYLRREKIELLIDATHPFAERMSANAEAACRNTGVPLVLFTRAPWTAQEGDHWREVGSANEAAEAIGSEPRRVFLTVGRLQLAAFAAAPQHDYLIRSIDPPDTALPRQTLILARGPFTLEDEVSLMRREAIDLLITKNSGGDASRAKLDAARQLGLDVILMRPPPRADAPAFHDLGALADFLKARRHGTLLGV